MTTCPRAAVLAALAATAIGCTACASLFTVAVSPARHQAVPGRHPAAACPTVSPIVALPVSPAGLRAAAALAARFAAAYLTRPPGQTPGRWLARLAPMVTSQLYAVLARTAAAPALWPPGQPPASAAVAAVRVRDLAAGSVILTVTVRVRRAGGAGTTTAGLAVTVVMGTAGWAVYDVEPATAGNTG
jgi:hypothetical protein